MKSLRSWAKIVVFLLLLCLAAFYFSYEPILRQIGRFLVFEQKPQKADVIVVLNGRDTERSLAAVDLYNQGFGNIIVMARGGRQPGWDEFSERVGKGFDRKIFFQRAIEAMGIPQDAFKLIGDGITSTYDEARVTRQWLKANRYKSIVLVTSKWHSKRAYLTFKSVFRHDRTLRITIRPSKYDTFDSDSWWKSETAAEDVFREYTRLIYYLFAFRISVLDLLP